MGVLRLGVRTGGLEDGVRGVSGEEEIHEGGQQHADDDAERLAVPFAGVAPLGEVAGRRLDENLGLVGLRSAHDDARSFRRSSRSGTEVVVLTRRYLSAVPHHAPIGR